jgi:diguanylate cyclase (GGDEF)-like protein
MTCLDRRSAVESQLSLIPVPWWWAGGAVLFFAIASGFIAGFCCARMSERRSHDRARSNVAHLYQAILATLATARELCGLLEKFPQQPFALEQVQQLDRQRGGLFEAISKVITRFAPAPPPAEPVEPEAPPITPFNVNWLKGTVDPSTDLPDRAAFESNLALLVQSGSAANRESTLLLVRVDKMAALVTRIGKPGAEKLMKRLGVVVCRAVRDQDLVCRCNGETLGVLFPGLDLQAASRLGRVIRDTVRNHHFHAGETGPEVFLTASFGCTPCRPEENADLVLNRAFDAVSQSQRLGRNQFHVHNGSALVHCAAV